MATTTTNDAARHKLLSFRNASTGKLETRTVAQWAQFCANATGEDIAGYAPDGYAVALSIDGGEGNDEPRSGGYKTSDPSIPDGYAVALAARHAQKSTNESDAQSGELRVAFDTDGVPDGYATALASRT